MLSHNTNQDIAFGTGTNIYLGIVEDRNDPEKLGRVRVRIIGIHSPSQSDLPTAALPWSTVMLPSTSPGMNGMGQNPFLVEGSWVVVMFMDSEYQEPLVLGSIAGKTTEKRDKNAGFSDPRGHYPRNNQLDESDINLRSRGEFDRRLRKEANYLEPDDPYASKYPFNHVFESESGHLIEFDDTPDNERINIQHRTGAFIEIDKDGNMRIRANNFYNSTKDHVINIDGNCNITVASNADIAIQGNTELNAFGTVTGNIKGETSLNIENETNINSIGDISLQSNANINMKAKGRISMQADENINVNTSAALDLTSKSTATVIGSTVQLNPGRSATDVDITELNYNLDNVIDVDINLSDPRYRAPELTVLNLPREGQSVADDDADTVLGPIVDSTDREVKTTMGSVTYTNSSATRNLPLNPRLENIIVSAAQATGLHVEIFSGGQVNGEVGSHRHDDGFAADIRLYKDSARTMVFRSTSAEAQNFIRALLDSGASSIGAGNRYMGGTGIHVDIAPGNTVPANSARYWGDNGRQAAAPSWLRSYFA